MENKSSNRTIKDEYQDIQEAMYIIELDETKEILIKNLNDFFFNEKSNIGQID